MKRLEKESHRREWLATIWGASHDAPKYSAKRAIPQTHNFPNIAQDPKNWLEGSGMGPFGGGCLAVLWNGLQ
eukprot:612187-Amphidinium_carterae.1